MKRKAKGLPGREGQNFRLVPNSERQQDTIAANPLTKFALLLLKRSAADFGILCSAYHPAAAAREPGGNTI